MNYFILQHDWEYSCIRDEDVFEPYVGEPINFGVELKISKIQVVCTTNILPDCLPNLKQLVIFNQKIISKLDSGGVDNIQYFDVDVLTADGTLISDDYKCLNVLKIVDCIDHDRSKLIWSEDDDWDRYIMDVRDLRLDYSKIKDNLLFRIEGCETLLVFREDLAKSILNNRCTGLAFYNAEGFSF
jgi:hypothetical protein